MQRFLRLEKSLEQTPPQYRCNRNMEAREKEAMFEAGILECLETLHQMDPEMARKLHQRMAEDRVRQEIPGAGTTGLQSTDNSEFQQGPENNLSDHEDRKLHGRHINTSEPVPGSNIIEMQPGQIPPLIRGGVQYITPKVNSRPASETRPKSKTMKFEETDTSHQKIPDESESWPYEWNKCGDGCYFYTGNGNVNLKTFLHIVAVTERVLSGIKLDKSPVQKTPDRFEARFSTAIGPLSIGLYGQKRDGQAYGKVHILAIRQGMKNQPETKQYMQEIRERLGCLED